MPKDGQRYGKAKAGQDVGDGMVGRRPPYRWHSFDWWYGHWDERDRCGAYRPDGSDPQVCWKDRGHGGKHRFRKAPPELLARVAASNRKAKSQARRTTGTDYSAYLEARYNQAERATNGVMLSAAGRRRGLSARRTWFSGPGPISSPNMSEELQDWFKANGRHATRAEFRQYS